MPRVRKAKTLTLSDYGYPRADKGMRAEILVYKERDMDRVHPQFVWLLKCDTCGKYRDRDELFEHPYALTCYLCRRKKGDPCDSALNYDPGTPMKEHRRAVTRQKAKKEVQSRASVAAPAAPEKTPEEREMIRKRNAELFASLSSPSTRAETDQKRRVEEFMARSRGTS